MFQKCAPRSLCRAVAALIFGMMAGTASAAVYTGSWDPAYGPAFPDLGWRGEARFFVPDACIARGPGIYREDFPGPGWNDCKDASVLGARVELYSLADPLEATLHTLLFPGGRFDDPDLVAIGLDGEFAGLRTGYATPPVVVIDNALLGAGSWAFSVRFVKDDVLPIGVARLNHGCVPGSGCGDSLFGESATAPDIAFQRVPLPGTLPLVALAALAMLGARRGARRRGGPAAR